MMTMMMLIFTREREPTIYRNDDNDPYVYRQESGRGSILLTVLSVSRWLQWAAVVSTI